MVHATHVSCSVSESPSLGVTVNTRLQQYPLDCGGPVCSELLDFSEDALSSTVDFVAEPPHFKRYAGVPLQTRNLDAKATHKRTTQLT